MLRLVQPRSSRSSPTPQLQCRSVSTCCKPLIATTSCPIFDLLFGTNRRIFECLNIIFACFTVQSDSVSLILDISEAHRLIIGLPSLFGDPYSPKANDMDFFPAIPFAVQAYGASFCHCFTDLTHSKSWWMSIVWTAVSGTRLAGHKTIRVTFFALDFLRKYIQPNA